MASCSPLLCLDWRAAGGAWHRVQTQLIGTYNALNMLAAACIGLHFGVSESQVCHALQAYKPSNNRSQLERTGSNTLVVDAYNANPTSMAAAIDNFSRMEGGPKMAIIGDMRELGDASAGEHQRVADALAAAGLDRVWLVGEEFARTSCPLPQVRRRGRGEGRDSPPPPRRLHNTDKGQQRHEAVRTATAALTAMPMTAEQMQRYARHTVLQGVGAEGQERIMASSALIVGAGGWARPQPFTSPPPAWAA